MGNPGRYLLAIGLFVFAPACLGDDPDHLDPSSGIQAGNFATSIPDTLHNRLLSQIGTVIGSTGTRTRMVDDWATSVDAPELCNGCTITLLQHNQGAGLEDVTVYNNQTNEILCHISVGPDAMTDTCGTSAMPDTKL